MLQILCSFQKCNKNPEKIQQILTYKLFRVMTSFSQYKTYIDVLRTERVNDTLCLVGVDPKMSKNAFNPRDLS